jgi:kinesin family member 11
LGDRPCCLTRGWGQVLATAGAEYAVRVSQLEIYNEELRDLHAAAWSDDGPASNNSNSSNSSNSSSSSSASSLSASMTGGGGGGGTTTAAAAAARTLRLYDDPQHAGCVVVQGAEDVAVATADDVIRLLRTGAARRRAAATNCNAQSRCGGLP